MMLLGVGLLGMVHMVGMMVRVGGRRREGLGEREGGILPLYILRVVSSRIDIGCVPDRELPSRHAGGVSIWVRRRWIVRLINDVPGTCAVEAIV